MANLKNITDLPIAESAEGLNLIVNDNGSAKQIAASAVGAQADFAVTDENNPAFIKNKPEVVQADWAETDENNAAFIKNKPVEEWDLDLIVDITWNAETSKQNDPVFTAAEGYTYDAFVAKVEAGDVPKVKIKVSFASSETNTFREFIKQPIILTREGMLALMWFGINGPAPEAVLCNTDGTFAFQIMA